MIVLQDPQPQTIRCAKCLLMQPAPPKAMTRADRWNYLCKNCGYTLSLLSVDIITERVVELKCWPEYFRQIRRGIKTCEIRRNDRGFKVGDILYLREWTPGPEYELNSKGEYTGHFVYVQVTHIASGCFGIPRDTVVMSITAPTIWRKKFIGAKKRKVLTI